MAIQLLENNCDNFKKCYDMQQVLTRKDARSKCTKIEGHGENFRGWNTKSIKRLSALVVLVKEIIIVM